ncbi:MAG: ribonuclease HII [Hyphomicrobiales bacterium]|nr:MAG: ribonuclease HII [Hyphomicrobiales bacterium]
MPMSLTEIRRRYVLEGRTLDRQTEQTLRADPREGMRAILAAIDQRRAANRAEGQRLRKLLRFESALWQGGLLHVAGIDEAGMSPLAGPVAAAAVVFPPGTRIPGVDDSKKLDPDEREHLALIIKRKAITWSVAMVDVADIDRINIYWAGILAMRRAVEGLSHRPQHLLIDARRLKDVALPQTSIVQGDAKSLSIAAASILAKTARDALMRQLDERHPGYGFARHKGYPVPEHLEALRKRGATDVHRRSFAAVRTALGLPPLPTWPAPDAACMPDATAPPDAFAPD